jgi:hypothetical protein
MDNNFIEEVTSKTTEELRDIAVNFNLYRGALVAAAKEELTNRGIELSDDEKQRIEEIKNKRKKDAITAKDSNKTWDSFNVKWKMNIVNDANAPQLYSRQVINIFSILFSVLFGGILMAINLKNTNNKKGILPVLAFSIGYTVLMGVGLYLIDSKTSVLTVVLNLLGAIVLYNYFWGKYIGKEFQYRTKPFWIPLVIGVAIFGLFLWSAIVGNSL